MCHHAFDYVRVSNLTARVQSCFHAVACDYSLWTLLSSVTLLHSMARCYVIILHYPLTSINWFPLIVAALLRFPSCNISRCLRCVWFVIVRLSLSITVRRSSLVREDAWGCGLFSVAHRMDVCRDWNKDRRFQKHSLSAVEFSLMPLPGGDMIDYYELFSISLMLVDVIVVSRRDVYFVGTLFSTRHTHTCDFTRLNFYSERSFYANEFFSVVQRELGPAGRFVRSNDPLPLPAHDSNFDSLYLSSVSSSLEFIRVIVARLSPSLTLLCVWKVFDDRMQRGD